MIENLIPILTILICSILLGICMKLADLFNEHNLRWFKGDAILFGILWGLLAGFLTTFNLFLASAWIAILIGYLMRGKIDYINHGIAAGITFLFFVLTYQTVNNLVFLIVLAIMLISGIIEDKKEIRLIKTYSLHDLLFYTLLPIYFWISSGEKMIFLSFFSYIISYEFTKFLFEKK